MLQQTLDLLRVSFTKKKIDDCKKKKHLKEFTTKQLKKWLKKNDIDSGKVEKKVYIDMIWDTLCESSSESETESSDSDSD